MARLNRLIIPRQVYQLTQKSIDNQMVFKDDQDHDFFLERLKLASLQFNVAIHAYVLMPNHYHLLLTPEGADGISKMMQWIGRYYVPYFNQKYQRHGTLWQGRFKASLIEADAYFIKCCQYIESNPLRSDLVVLLKQYRWSSHLHHVGAQKNPLITEHALYWRLGNTPFAREAAYKSMFDNGLTKADVEVITQVTLKGWALGSEKFKILIEQQNKQRVQPALRGRPRKILLD